MLSKVCNGVFTYPWNAFVPSTSAMSSGLFLFHNCKFSQCVVPNSGWTWWIGVSLSEDLSSVGVNDVSVSNSSVTLSCWRAGVWGAGGANKGDGSMRIRVSLVWNTGIHSSVGGTVCVSYKLNPCVICFDLSLGA